ncbi:Beta-galactosidase 16 [Spatholobus suberectus]|nr:Beta-galactosidase 16 [Spatholobus suberectus]
MKYQNSGAYLERRVAGLRRVKVQGRDFTNQAWAYQVGLLGEKLQIYTAGGLSKVQWESFQSSTKPLTWYKTTFDAPVGNDPVVLNLGSMGKGYTWVNGQGIGRYWVSFHTPQGTPSQKWYHIPLIPPNMYWEPTSSTRRRNWEPTRDHSRHSLHHSERSHIMSKQECSIFLHGCREPRCIAKGEIYVNMALYSPPPPPNPRTQIYKSPNSKI